MPRQPRLESPGAVYHVTARGVERRPVFVDDGDRRSFLDLLEKVTRRHGWLCHAYCLMGNHFHLVIETPLATLARGMQLLSGTYAQRFNRRYGRVGHLFQERYSSILVEREAHLLEACRYVVLNPVRARSCHRPADWRWSSYRPTVGLDARPPFLTLEWILGQFGRDRKHARVRYAEFVADGLFRFHAA